MGFNSILGGDEWDEDNLIKELNRVTPFSSFDPIDFVKPKLDLKLDPNHFIKWLKAESENDQYLDPPLGESYSFDVGSMCEYACLYVAMLLRDTKLKGELRIISGKFGFWEHYWLRYTIDGERYIIDLTLQQFVKTAPKVAICVEHITEHGYNNEFDEDGTLISDYIIYKRALEFYTDPKNVK